MTLKNLLGENGQANFSISVRKRDGSKDYKAAHTDGFQKASKQNEPNSNKKIYLPELRGELFRGKVVDKESNLPLELKPVALSSVGGNSYLSVSNTNKEGLFYFNLEEGNFGTDVIVQVLGEGRENSILQMETREYIDHDKFSFEKVVIASEVLNAVLGRSVHSQIENAYSEVKVDSIIVENQTFPFYRDLFKLYDLDDYTRFPTVKETLVEVIDNAWIEKNQNGESVFKVRDYGPYFDLETLPLVIVDGTILQRHEDLVGYDARKIQKFGLYRDKFRIGPQVFQGALVVETINKDFGISTDGNHILRKELLRPLPQKEILWSKLPRERENKIRSYPGFSKPVTLGT